MKTQLSTLIGGFVICVFALALLAFTYSSPAYDDWVVPAKYKTMKNPYAGKKDAENTGKNLYRTNCASCHGKEGHGDGTKAAMLESDLRDFAGKDVQAQTDGELYYKSFIGKDEMPNFEKKVPSEEDRWYLVNFLRTLAQ